MPAADVAVEVSFSRSFAPRRDFDLTHVFVLFILLQLREGQGLLRLRLEFKAGGGSSNGSVTNLNTPISPRQASISSRKSISSPSKFSLNRFVSSFFPSLFSLAIPAIFRVFESNEILIQTVFVVLLALAVPLGGKRAIRRTSRTLSRATDLRFPSSVLHRFASCLLARYDTFLSLSSWFLDRISFLSPSSTP